MTVRALVAALLAELVGFALAGIVIVDLHLHNRFEEISGVNVQGYRGPLRPRHAPNELRLLVVGDGSAFGYGVSFSESFPECLANRLVVERDRVVRGQMVRIINAASIGDGAHALRFAVRDFARVTPDIVLVDAGYDALCDGCTGERRVSRRESAIFRATGYMPMLPRALREKGAALRRAPSEINRLTGRAFEAAARVAYAADRATDDDRASDARADVGCSARWTAYCGAIRAAVADALQYARVVVVMTPPYASDRHREQQRDLAAMLEHQFGRDDRVVHVNEGDAVDLRDPDLTFDGVHLTARGSEQLAEVLVSPIGKLLDRW